MTTPSFFNARRFLVLGIIVWLGLACAPWARAVNDPGGGAAGVGANVTLSVSGTTATLSNGVITAAINTSNGRVTSYLLNGVQMLDTSGQIYYSMDGGTSYENPKNCVYSAKINTADMVDISCKQTWTSGGGYVHAFDIDVHYVLRRGDTGLYAYATLNHPATYPATSMGEWRMVWKLPHNSTDFTFERAYVDALRNWQMESYYDFTHGVVQGIQEILLLTTGLRNGKYDCKYEYGAEYGSLGCWGHASNTNRKGVWVVLGSHEYFNDGPVKYDLTLAESYTLIHFGMNHFGGSSTSIADGEAWTKTFGPFLLYCNSTAAATNAGDALWADAQTQAVAETAAWPYSWLTNNPNYPLAAERGTVTGKFIVKDALKPALTGANAWVGVTQVDSGGNWQYDSKHYQHWIKSDASGNFSIPAVRPGVYTLYGFVDGAVGEYSRANVTVAAGQTLALGDVTWNVTHPGGVIAWEIGVPNRSASEFKHGHAVTPAPDPLTDFYYYEPYLWQKFVTEWTNPLEYNVGTSNYATDWNYAQSVWNVNGTSTVWKWRVNFNLASVPATGNATLTLAFAGSDSARLDIFVNNESSTFSSLYPPNSGGNNLLREGIHGKYGLSYVTIPVSKLRAGANTITLVQGRPSGDGNNILYDYVNLEMPAVPAPPPGRDLVWKGGASSNAWDLGTTANFLVSGTSTPAVAFALNDRPLFDDTGSTSPPIALNGVLTPGQITFNNGSAKNYVLGGKGSITGQGTMIKNGAGTLTISPTLTTLSSTTASGSASATAASSTLGVGMSVSGTGIPAGTTISAIPDAAHVTLSQSATASGTNTLTYNATYAYSGGTTINGGSIVLASENANNNGLGSGKVTLNGGTLKMYDYQNGNDAAGWSIEVPAGSVGTLLADSRVDLSGALKGSGVFNLQVPWVRTTLLGDWSDFSGQINVTTDADGGDFRAANALGYGKAAINLGPKVSMYYSPNVNGNGDTVPIGELTGDSTTVLMGGPTASGARSFTWKVGGRDSDPSINATFAGVIKEQGAGPVTSIMKVGAGMWTLSGASTYTGATTVAEGTLKLSGSFTGTSGIDVTSDATLNLSGGTISTAGTVHVGPGGTLTGCGTINAVMVNDGQVAVDCGGVLNVSGSITNNGTMMLTNGSSLQTGGVFTNNGVLDLINGAQGLPANFVNHGAVLDATTVKTQTASMAGGAFSVTVQGYVNHTYQLQKTASLSPVNWQPVGAAQSIDPDAGSSSATLTFTDAGASGGQGFYRVSVTPSP